MSATTWTSPVTSDWNTASDWSTGVVPDDSATDVLFSQSGAYTVSIAEGESFSVDAVTISGAGGTLQVNGTLAAAGATPSTGDVIVGESAGDDGTLSINSGGTVLVGGAQSVVGLGAGSVGNLIINAGGVWDETVTPQSNGIDVLSIGANAGSDTLAPATGNVLVTGVGALLDMNGNPLGIGDGSGTGALTVTNGGTVVTGGLKSGSDVIAAALGMGRLGTGVLVVTGAGSEVIADGFVFAGRAGTATIEVENGGSMLVGLDPTGDGSLYVGAGSSGANNGQGSNGALTVTTDGVLTDEQNLTVGGNGVNGEVNVNTGGTIQVDTSLLVGNATKLSGTIYGGSGALSIGAGGTVELTGAPSTTSYEVNIGDASSSVGGATDLATGEVTVTGPGALLDTNGSGIAVGEYANGILTVGQGGTVETGTPNTNGADALGIGRQGDGNVIIDGGSLLADGGIYIGRAGTGNLQVSNNGILNIGLDGTDSTTDANLEIGGAHYTGGTVLYVGGTGSMEVSSDGTVTSLLSVDVGLNGATGDLSINSGGVVESAQQIVIGVSATIAAGDTLISPSGTTVVAVATLEAGDGSVDIGPGGTLEATGPQDESVASVYIGEQAGTTGDITVHGAGALLSTGGNRLVVGGFGDGNMTVNQGGSVLAGTGFEAQEAVDIGGGATGAVTVADAGSDFTADGQINVGAGSTGSLLIENQASVFAGGNALAPTQGFDVGTDAGAAGSVTVTGDLSLLSNTGQFVVGDGGLGSLSIQSGATVTTTPGTVAGLAAAVVANQAGAGGSSVNVTGVGTDWQIAGALIVGNADTGLLAITNGASVSATTLDVGDQSSGAGIATVSGPNADLVTTGTVTVGDSGSGELSILNGANANIGGDLNIANAGTGTGNVDIEDTTGTITFGGNILVGFNGFGVFNVGFNVDYIQNNGGIIFGPDSSGAINSFADPSPFLSNSSPSPISIGAQGVDQLAAYLFNSGEFTIPTNHSLTFDTPIISGGGSFALGSGDNLVLNAGTVAGQTFTLGSNDKLTIGIDQLATIDLPASGTGPFTPESNPNKGDLLLGNFGGVIANFTSGDTIDVDTYLSSASAGTLSQNGALVSVIEIANGATLGVLRFDTAANATAAIADDAITLVPCFAAGTRISTERGEVAVEAIGVGERVQVLLGDGFSEVIWVGRRDVDCADHPTPRKVWPVLVSAGAFGPGRPYHELFLSPDHAVYINDVLIPVKHLINGSTIAQVPVQRVTYHHIELAAHNVLLAEGLPAESFLDMRDGSNYANRPGPIRLYPDFSVRMWEAFGCARLVVTGPELEAARVLVAGFASVQKAA